jgi:hypothetical protein
MLFTVRNFDKVRFHPYFSTKDLFGALPLADFKENHTPLWFLKFAKQENLSPFMNIIL